jgi:hypothetical protein
MSMQKQRKKIDQKKGEILSLQKQRHQLLRALFTDCELIEGSFRESLVRCGHPGCHCETRPVHLVTRLSRWENGKLKNKVVRVADRKSIKQLSNNYKAHKQAFSELIKIHKIECNLIKAVIQLKAVKYM